MHIVEIFLCELLNRQSKIDLLQECSLLKSLILIIWAKKGYSTVKSPSHHDEWWSSITYMKQEFCGAQILNLTLIKPKSICKIEIS